MGGYLTIPVSTDPITAALERAASEQRARGELSADTVRLLRRLTASGPHDRRLSDRDEAVLALSDLEPSASTWAAAGRVAQWLRRYFRGDPLADAPAEAADLCAAVGKALSHRQCFRILSGDRSA